MTLKSGGPIRAPFMAVTSAAATFPRAISRPKRDTKAVGSELLKKSGGS